MIWIEYVYMDGPGLQEGTTEEHYTRAFRLRGHKGSANGVVASN